MALAAVSNIVKYYLLSFKQRETYELYGYMCLYLSRFSFYMVYTYLGPYILSMLLTCIAYINELY